ncbi:hypothetical protein [Roseovarius nanhaiticus]|uniref:hypothetical protein n=1 Tax=Roseovarius nanhaiticus TaxID=573024 RepID=UPI002493576C|nr:hypothetical protein [Roseovarius nanhaiticus]
MSSAARLVPAILAAGWWLALPSPAWAGPWLRTPGEGFLSWSVKIQDDANSKGYSTLYAEYGMNPDLTVGLDLGSDDGGKAKALAFVVMPLSRGPLHITFELGAGTSDDSPAFRPGISVGRGITLAGLGGWWSIDTRAAILEGSTDLSIDATLGLRPWDGTMLIAQLQQGGALTEPDTLRLTGSVVWETQPGHHIEVGLASGLKNGEDFGIQLGIWRSF